MKRLIAIAAALLVALAAQPLLATGPHGTWTWTTVVDQEVRVSTLKLKFDSEGKTLEGYFCPSQREQIVPLTRAIYRDGDITVTVVMEHQGQKYEVTFQGSRSGHEIFGTRTIVFEGKTYVAQWSASRWR